jgi:GTP cyclohydrolase I
MRGKTDSELGLKVHSHLKSLGLETLVNPSRPKDACNNLEQGVKAFLSDIGLDLEDPSLKETPRRVAEMFAWELCAGLDYASFPKCTTTPNGAMRTIKSPFQDLHTRGAPETARFEAHTDGTFTATWQTGVVDEMVMLDTITTTSLCEHHFQTITGKTHIAYIPKDKILGVSKFARVTNFFGRRPQIQERMTEQIYAALAFILGTPDIAVQQVCVHNCIRARGAMDPHSKMTTSKLGGKFKDNTALRGEFLHGIR